MLRFDGLLELGRKDFSHFRQHTAIFSAFFTRRTASFLEHGYTEAAAIYCVLPYPVSVGCVWEGARFPALVASPEEKRAAAVNLFLSQARVSGTKNYLSPLLQPDAESDVPDAGGGSMLLHTAVGIPLEAFRGRQISSVFWLWVNDFIAAFGLILFIASAWVLIAVVQATIPG
ncbi:MAG TPA: hypothetical protein VGJ08_01810 [Rhizomicrobium sp.]